MSNVYLEKIALSVEDAASARKSGARAFRRTEAVGTTAGASAGAAYGATLGYKRFVRNGSAAEISRSVRGATPKKIKAAVAVGSAIVGGLAANVLSQPAATKARNKAHAKSLNKYLDKSAEITASQVRKRNNQNDAIKAVAATQGLASGALTGAAAGLGYSAVRSGALPALKQDAKNKFATARATKKLSPGVTLMGKEKSLQPFVNKAAIKASTGNIFRKAGVIGAVAGAIVGGRAKVRDANRKADEGDSKYYSKIKAKNKADFMSKGR